MPKSGSIWIYKSKFQSALPLFRLPVGARAPHPQLFDFKNILGGGTSPYMKPITSIYLQSQHHLALDIEEMGELLIFIHLTNDICIATF